MNLGKYILVSTIILSCAIVTSVYLYTENTRYIPHSASEFMVVDQKTGQISANFSPELKERLKGKI